MEHKLIAELVVYRDPNDKRQVKFLRLDGHCEMDFVEYLIDLDTTREIIEDLFNVDTNLPEKGAICYKAPIYYSYDRGDRSVGIWPGWIFNFGLDVEQIHPDEEQYYLPEPYYEFPQDDGHETEFYDAAFYDAHIAEWRKEQEEQETP